MWTILYGMWILPCPLLHYRDNCIMYVDLVCGFGLGHYSSMWIIMIWVRFPPIVLNVVIFYMGAID
jgi:hypothetical protein